MKLLGTLVRVGGLVGVIATALGFLGREWWVFDLFSSFRAQYCGLLAPALLHALWTRRLPLLALAGGALAANAALVAPLFLSPGASTAGGEGVGFTLETFNVWMDNDTPEAVLEHLLARPADLVFLAEVNTRLFERLHELDEVYEIFGDGFNFLLLARDHPNGLRMLDSQVEEVAGQRAIVSRLEVGGRAFELLGIHTSPPLSAGHVQRRTNQFKEIGAWYLRQEVPAVICGDLNATPFTPCFRKLMAETDLHDSSLGFGYQGSWPRNEPVWFTWLFRVPIDHVLHSPTLRTLDRHTGPSHGSNHLPVRVELQLAD